MEANNIIREIVKEQEVTQSTIAKRLGVGNNVITNRLTRGGMSINALIEMLSVLDYDLVAVPRSKQGKTLKVDKYEGGSK